MILDGAVPVCDAVLLQLAVALDNAVPVCDPVPLRLAVALDEEVPVCDASLLLLAVALHVGDTVAMLVIDEVMVDDGVGAAEPLGVRMTRDVSELPASTRKAPPPPGSHKPASALCLTPTECADDGISCVTLALR